MCTGEVNLEQQNYQPTNQNEAYNSFDQSGAGTSGGGRLNSDKLPASGGGGRRSDEPAAGGGGGGLLHSMEQAGTSLLRAAMSLVPTIRFKPWPPNRRPPPHRRQDDRRRAPEQYSLPDTGRLGEWKPLVI